MQIVDNLVTGLGGSEGYGEITMPRGDDNSFQVDLSPVFERGFLIDGSTSTTMSVSTNGFVTVGSSANSIAPFSTDLDATRSLTSGEVHIDVDQTSDTVTVTWDNLQLWSNYSAPALAFQLQIKDEGNGLATVTFRYGDTDFNVSRYKSIGVNGFEGQGFTIPEIRDAQPDEVSSIIGNTGEVGVWEFSLAVGPQIGTTGDDILDGNARNDDIFGDDGNDTISGRGGNDRLFGEGDNDILNGGRGDDTLFGGSGGDTLRGGTGTDTASYQNATNGVTANMSDPTQNTASAAGDTYVSIENLTGSAHGDILTGNNTDNTIQGLNGDDVIFGGKGNDTLFGGNGNDFIDGGKGFDIINGGAGFDTLSYEGQKKGVKLTLNTLGDETSGVETTFGIERLIGSDVRDIVNASRFEAAILEGGLGNDRLIGGRNNDTLRGDEGDDQLSGGSGDDLLRGGDGADRFIFATSNGSSTGPGSDRVLDFDASEDTLVLRLGDIAQISGFSGTAQELFDAYAVSTAAGIELIFDTKTSIELIGVTDLAGTIAATELF
ncbi:MAG: calcium-binding protein [Sedimentitalea sp.]